MNFYGRGIAACALLIALTLQGCNPAPSLPHQLEEITARFPEATVAVAVRDSKKSVTVDLESDRIFHAASTMKIPVMIEAWRRERQGTLYMDQLIEVQNLFHSIVDSSEFSIQDDTDDAIYERLGEQMSISELIYQMITVSSNLATNLLIDFLSADSIQQTVNSLDAPGMQVLRGVEDLKAFELGLSNRTTAEALATLLDAILQGRAVDAEADHAMIEVMLDAQFNEMIPAGLPDDVAVAHKTGQITEIHHDAAIVMPSNDTPYVLVVLIQGLPEDSVSAALGAEIAQTVHASLRGS